MSKIDKFIKEYKNDMYSVLRTDPLPTYLHRRLLKLAKATNEDIEELKKSLLTQSDINLKDLEQLQEEFSPSQIHFLKCQMYRDKRDKIKSNNKPRPKGPKGCPPPMSTASYVPGQRTIHTEESLISGATLLEKARQMEEKQQFVVSNSAFSPFENYREGILTGINRIIDLIERHYKS